MVLNKIIQMAREAGAKKVYFASCAPPIRFPNVYGIDLPSRDELIAYNRTEEEISKVIGADLVIFNAIDDLVASVSQFNPSIKNYDLSVFNGKYITGNITEDYLVKLEKQRSDSNKKYPAANDVIGLFNQRKQK